MAFDNRVAQYRAARSPVEGSDARTVTGRLAGGRAGLAWQGRCKVPDHGHKAGRNYQKRRPAQGVAEIAFANVHRRAIGEDAAEQETRGQAAEMGPVVGVQGAYEQADGKNR